MKSEKSGNFIRPFQRKAERLDWRKVASLDIDKVFQEADWEQLKELLNQITFCHPESEFNQENTDPGFIKVFRISQILMEYLVSSQDANKEREEELQSRCQELEAATKTYLEQIENLKLSLLSAKKELRKRKELLASTQGEVLLGEEKDEFDQCPYCKKKFLTETYLYAHMQRRHQGLPIQSAFPRSFHNFPNVGFPIQQTFPMVYSNTEAEVDVKSVAITASTQTEIGMRADASTAVINHDEKSKSNEPPGNDGNENINDSIEVGEPIDRNVLTSHRIDLHTVSELVEKYLEQKSIARQNQHYDEILSTIRAASENRDKDFLERRASFSIEKNSSGDSSRKSSFRAANPITTVSIEEAERSVSKMREELQIQWHALKGQVHESGIEELKERLLTEMQKMQELIINSPRMNKDADVVEQTKVDDQSVLEKSMDERFQKQEEQLEEIKQSLQAKVQADLGVLQTKLDVQEEYWKSKLASVEEKYQQQLSNLKDELQQASYQKPEVENNFLLPPRHEKLLECNEEQKEEVTDGNFNVDGEVELAEANDAIDENNHFAPVAKPRKTISIPATTSVVTVMKVAQVSTNKSATNDVKSQRRLAPQPPLPNVAKETTKSQVHEYEEPQTIQKNEVVSDYSYSLTASETSESETQVETDEELVEEKQVKLPKQTAAKYVFDSKKRKLVPIPNGSSGKEQLDKMAELRKKAVDEISDQMQKFGIHPDENGILLTKEELRKNLKKLKSSRSAVTDDVDKFEAQRSTLKKQVDTAAKKLAFEDKIEKTSLHMGLTTLPELKPPPQGPLTKILRAVKNSRNRKQTTKTKNVSSPRQIPKKKHRLKTFFSRANWGKKSKEADNEKVSGDEETSDGESSIDQDMGREINRSKVSTKHTSRKTKRNHSPFVKNSMDCNSNERSDTDDDSDKFQKTFQKKREFTQKGTDNLSKKSEPTVSEMTTNSSGRYVTLGNRKPIPMHEDTTKNISEHKHMNGVFNAKKIPSDGGAKTRDLLVEFQEAEEVLQAKAASNKLYSPIQKTPGDRNYYDSDEKSGESQPNYSQHELSEYSEEDENEKKQETSKNAPKGQYVTLRHPVETSNTNPDHGNRMTKVEDQMETSTPILSRPQEKPRPATSSVKPRIHTELFSSASAWDSDSDSEKISSTKQNQHNIITKKENGKMIIPSVAPKVISKSAPSPFKIIKKPIPTVNPTIPNSTATGKEKEVQKLKSNLNNSWDSDFDF